MVNALLNGIISFISGLVGVLLSPIDNLINNTIPQFQDVLTLFGNFIDYISAFIPWGLSWFHIPAFVLSFLIYYLIAKVGISASVHLFKLALAWWRTLKP